MIFMVKLFLKNSYRNGIMPFYVQNITAMSSQM